MLPDEYVTVAYLRVASMAVGAYELICTLPAEYRFYRQQILRHSLSQQCLLFILIRYMSVAVVVVSNVGFFGRFSSIEACRQFMLVSPIFKALQTFVSQLILASRTYSISRKSRWVLWTMMVTLAITVPMEFFSNIHGRTPVHDPILQNCTSGNASSHRVAWIHYLDAMIFDLIAIVISTGYLWLYSATAIRISHFVRRLLYEGLGYFVVLTAVNVFNLVLYLRRDEKSQSSGASLGYVLIFIMSQRILIRQRDYADKYNAARLPSTSRQVSISRRLDSTREINEALRSQFDRDSASVGGGLFDSLGSKQSMPTPRPPSWYSCSHPQSPKTAIETEEVGLDLRREEGGEVKGGEEGREDGMSPLPPSVPGIPTRQSQPESENTFDVEVRVERTVSVQRIPDAVALGRESYRRPRVIWDRRPAAPTR